MCAATGGNELTTGEVLAAIAANLTSIKSTAALNHYPSLRIQTRNLNLAMRESIDETGRAIAQLKTALADDNAVAAEFRQPQSPLRSYRPLAPRIIENFLLIARKLLDQTPPEPPLTVDEIGQLHGKFEDFCDLATSVRQFVDTLVETTYQLCALDPKYLNYKILDSLASFIVVATPSLQVPIYSADLEKIVQRFVSMSSRDRRRSEFAHVANEQFPQRVKFLCDVVHPSFHSNVEGNLNSVFKFCSDFAHIGYVSTLVIGSDRGSFVMEVPVTRSRHVRKTLLS